MAKLRLICAILALALTAGSASAALAAHGRPENAVPMEARNGAFVVPVVLNNVMTEKFIVDSGSADVSIPADIAATLKTLGALTAADFLGNKTYILADGSRSQSEIYRVASIKIGEMVIRNVTVRIAAEKSDLLLGQSFLSRLKSWSIDNARQLMIIN